MFWAIFSNPNWLNVLTMNQPTHYNNQLTINMAEELMFKADTEKVLVRGLNAMTKACDALTKQNDQLNKDIEGLKRKIDRLQDRILVNQEAKE